MRLPIRSIVKPGRFLGWLRRPPPAEPVSKKIVLNSPRITQSSSPPKASDPLAAYLTRVKAAQGKPPDTTFVNDPVEKLLLERRLGTVVELLQQQAEAQPENFDVWLRYAEAYGHHCGDVFAAEKIIQWMERSRNFKKAQLKKAHARLKKWRKEHPVSNSW